MTEERAHELLHEVLPPGTGIFLRRDCHSRSTVGAGPVVHGGAWHLTVTAPDSRFNALKSGDDLADVVRRVIMSLPDLKPPKVASPSVRPTEQLRQREAS